MAAKRLSSIFSMGSNVSDQSSESRVSASVHPAQPPREHSQSPKHALGENGLVHGSVQQAAVNLSRKPLPNMRPTSNLQNLHSEQSSGYTPPFDPTILPRIEDDDILLNPPTLLKPLPIRTQSPSSSLGGSRPVSRGNPLDTRPASRGNQFDSRSSSRPASSRPPSRPPSQPASRPTSPIKFRPSTPTARPSSQPTSRPASPTKFRPSTPTAHPLTPTTEAKPAKRKNWMPGKIRQPGQDGGDNMNSPQAWLVTPKEKIPYDVSELANFHRVRSISSC